MNQPVLYGVYVARFPFLGSDKSKSRPVVVVGQPHVKYPVVVIVPISSRLKLEPVDVVLRGWGKAGLLQSSVARTHRLTSMLQADLTSQLGSLSTTDKKNLQQAIKSLFDL